MVGGPEAASAHTLDLAAWAFYSSAAAPVRSTVLLDQLRTLYPGWRVLPAGYARDRIFLGQLDQAQEVLDGLLADAPEDALGQAVRAEILYARGESQAGQNLAEALLARPALVPWLAESLRLLIRSNAGD